MPLKARLLRREVLPFLASFVALVLLALALDGLLHLFDLRKRLTNRLLPC